MDLDLFLPYIKHVFNPRKKPVMPVYFSTKESETMDKKDSASAIFDNSVRLLSTKA